MTARADERQRRITADRAVEIREDKGPAHILLIDSLHAGAGLRWNLQFVSGSDWLEQFYDDAIKLFAARKMRGWTKFADDAIVKAQRLNARSRLTPDKRFGISCRIRVEPE